MIDINAVSFRAAVAAVANIAKRYRESGDEAGLYTELQIFFADYDKLRADQIESLEKLALDRARTETRIIVERAIQGDE